MSIKEMSRVAGIESRLEAGYYWFLNPESKQYQICKITSDDNGRIILLPPDVTDVNENELIKA